MVDASQSLVGDGVGSGVGLVAPRASGPLTMFNESMISRVDYIDDTSNRDDDTSMLHPGMHENFISVGTA